MQNNEPFLPLVIFGHKDFPKAPLDLPKFKKSGCFENLKVLAELMAICNGQLYLNRTIFGDFIAIFEKKTMIFLLCLLLCP